MITYRGIITYFEAITDAHQQINSFTYGEADLYDKDKFTKYPALHLTPTGTAIDDQTITYGFDVIVYDRYDVANNKMRNEANSLSDSLLILQDLCKELTEGKYFIHEDTLISMEVPVICQPFIDTEPDNCSGWFTSFQVITPNEVNACNIPYHNPEIWKREIDGLPNQYIILPENIPTIGAVLWTALNVNSKITFDGDKNVSQFLPIYDNNLSGGTDRLDLHGEFVKYNFQKNAFHFIDTNENKVCYLESSQFSHIGDVTIFLTIKDFSRFGVNANGNSSSNSLISFLSSTGLINVAIDEDTGKVAIQRGIPTPVHTEATEYAVCPTNGTSHSDAHRRYEPLTIAIIFDNSTDDIIMRTSYNFYGKTTLDGDGFRIANGFTFIGSKNTDMLCDFYMKEFFFVEKVCSMQEIVDTMQWLNFR